MLKQIVTLIACMTPILCIANGKFGYTEDELRQLQKMEQNTILPDEYSESIENTHKQALDFQAESLRVAQEWNNKLSSNDLSPALDIGQLSNPQAKPSGIMVFVSLSMPRPSLIALLKQSEDLQIPLIIRGVLPSDFPFTIRQMESLIRSESPPIKSGFAFNSEWFKQFNIQKVPTFVVVKDGRCLPHAPCGANDFDMVSGNVSMYQALDVLKTGDNASIVNKHLEIIGRE